MTDNNYGVDNCIRQLFHKRDVEHHQAENNPIIPEGFEISFPNVVHKRRDDDPGHQE